MVEVIKSQRRIDASVYRAMDFERVEFIGSFADSPAFLRLHLRNRSNPIELVGGDELKFLFLMF
jgi:hypothetical protein